MCTGWDCQINGTIYKRTQNQQDRASDIRVLLDHVSWCSPSPRNQEVITNKEGEFSFNLYIHDTDTIRIKVEEIGYENIEIIFGGVRGCSGCRCNDIEILLELSN